MQFPDDLFAKNVADQSALIRRIFVPWAIGDSVQEINKILNKNVEKIVQSLPNNSNVTWKVDFARIGKDGKSGLDYAGKRQLLLSYDTFLEKLPGEVNLEHPDYQMVYLEDCQSYEDKEIDQSSRRKRLLFGRLVGSGKNIAHKYDLKTRPYVFSSSMNPVCAHVAAVAALPSAPFHAEAQDTREGVVLDPFCGTASTLVAAAHLGMKVVGTDIFLGSGMNAPKSSSSISSGRPRSSASQLRLSGVYDNFEKYQLTKQIEGFFVNDALNWLILDHKDFDQRGFEKVSGFVNEFLDICLYREKIFQKMLLTYDQYITSSGHTSS
jgi:tRNA G10  N-methylase Trm11